MAVEGIRIRVTEDTISDGLAALGRRAADLSRAMSAIAAYMLTATQRHFETETGPDGKWPRLKPRTAARRIGRRRRGTANILRVTNRLYSSVTPDSGPDFAAVGTNLVYAAIHQFGGTIERQARQQDVNLSLGKGRRRFVKAGTRRKETRRVQLGAHSITIPARPYLYLTEGDMAEILDIVAEEIARP